MNNQDSDINKYGSCLTREEMVQYLNGNLSDSEQHRIEIHLLDCELCEDAMTGLEGMADKSQITAIDDQLHTEIDVLLHGEKEEKVKVLFPWRMAAAFALLLVSTAVLFLILPKKDEMELFTQEFKPYPAPIDSVVLQTPGTVLSEKEISLNQEPLPSNKLTKKVPIKDAQQSTTEEDDRTTPAEDIADNSLSVVAAQEEKMALSDREDDKTKSESLNKADSIASVRQPASAANEFSNVPDQNAGATAVMKEQVEITSAKKSRTHTAPASSAPQRAEDESGYRAGIVAYQQQNYQEAIKYLGQSNHPEAIFYLGLSYLSIDNPHSAITHLEKYLQSGDKKYEEAAWWYCGLSFMKTKNQRASKKALEKVILFHGEFEQQATDLLRKL
ncbi:MAG: hypothetical protein IPN36_14260 [Bacteroidetes bacterium]|nr:hypothetical protein [Bacteroidota bacterium]